MGKVVELKKRLDESEENARHCEESTRRYN